MEACRGIRSRAKIQDGKNKKYRRSRNEATMTGDMLEFDGNEDADEAAKEVAKKASFKELKVAETFRGRRAHLALVIMCSKRLL